MSKYIPGNQKHLTLNDRIYIENELFKGTSFKDIAAFLCKDPTTISKEVRAHRLSDWYHKGTFYNAKNFCIHRYHCQKTNACGKIILCDIKCTSCPTCNQTCKDFQKKDIYLVLVYGITEHPMMLATNKKIQSKEDVVIDCTRKKQRYSPQENLYTVTLSVLL